MIIIDKTVISSDVENELFVCDLQKCKGACCVEGDLGAPLTDTELDEIDAVTEVVRDYLPQKARDVLDREGGYQVDDEGEFTTTTVNDRECVFAFWDTNGILKCGIEQAWKDGKTSFRKPISCHLYPIRVQKLDEYEALNYDRWDICASACANGSQLGVPVYRFLKEPLIRKYGEVWYDRLEEEIAKGKQKS